MLLTLIAKAIGLVCKCGSLLFLMYVVCICSLNGLTESQRDKPQNQMRLVHQHALSFIVTFAVPLDVNTVFIGSYCETSCG